MRYLNKIVFVNSATVPYAEVPLDGNIHFIGTQGVGKSTILRAILYFYNADSQKLGIPKGRIAKTFAEFYLSYSNSYIIYEVVKETGAFCVVAYKSQNRVCYRFIDTAYKPEYFIKESGDAFDNWGLIRETLNSHRVNVSSVVNSYEKYRDILYGNFTGRSEFNKYALLEAKQYQNIYRTIQNVFLNTKLDANEIKQTIISSIEDERTYIDLDQYKSHLNGFEKNIEDIRRFRFPSVQRQAESAGQLLSAIRHLNGEQSTLVGHLLYRLEYIEREAPALKERKLLSESSLQDEKTKLDYEKKLFGKRLAALNATISELKGKLKDAAKQKKYYDSKNITALIERVRSEATLKLELDSLQKTRQLLTHQFSDISTKYDTLIKEEENQLAAYKVQKEGDKNTLDSDFASFVMTLNKEYEQLNVALDEEFKVELGNEKIHLNQCLSDLQSKEKRRIEIKHTRLYEKEIEQFENGIKNALFLANKAGHDKESYNQQIENLRIKWESEKSAAESRSSQIKKQLHKELNDWNKQLKTISDRLEKSKDSLYTWLNENKAGWESTIGKVIDKELLFQGQLAPQLVEESSSLFGVKLNLNDLDSDLKSMDDYRFELQQLEANIEKHKVALEKETGVLQQELDKIQRRNSPKIKELKEKMRQAEYQCDYQSEEKKKLEVKLEAKKTQALNEKQEQLQLIQAEIDKANALRLEAEASFEACNAKLRQKKENKQREKSRRVNAAEKEAKAKKAELQHQVEEKQKTTATNILNLKAERHTELETKGADTGRLSKVEKQITGLENELQFIALNRVIVIEYHKDKRELFDKEKYFRNEISALETKIEHRTSEYSNQKNNLSKKIEVFNKQIEATKALILEYQNDLEKHKVFSGLSPYRVFEAYKALVEPIENEKLALTTIEEITEKYYLIKEKQDDLKTHIDKFLAHFSEGNIFSFPSKLLGTEAYMTWAEELNDFRDEGKIDEFEKRTNERFADIISSVGKDTTDLISKTGEINKIINKINADFKQKNFVTAVDNIEMGITDSKNSAVLLLKRIKMFNDDNALNIGAANLFSGDDQGQNNEKAVDLLKQLVKVMDTIKNSEIQLTDSFELSFRVVENGNDTGWADKLTNVGSEGTDVLVKAMVNIMLLNVFKEGASRKFKDFKLHCMMDEIGKLHPTNVKGILKFANERNILLINGSPTESTPLNYRHIYKISKDEKKQSKVKRIISNPLV